MRVNIDSASATIILSLMSRERKNVEVERKTEEATASVVLGDMVYHKCTELITQYVESKKKVEEEKCFVDQSSLL